MQNWPLSSLDILVKNHHKETINCKWPNIDSSNISLLFDILAQERGVKSLSKCF